MIEATTRSTVRFNLIMTGQLVDRIEDQSAITEGSYVVLRDGCRYFVNLIVNPVGVTYSIAYVSATGSA